MKAKMAELVLIMAIDRKLMAIRQNTFDSFLMR